MVRSKRNKRKKNKTRKITTEINIRLKIEIKE